jgi:hypothetical protein
MGAWGSVSQSIVIVSFGNKIPISLGFFAVLQVVRTLHSRPQRIGLHLFSLECPCVMPPRSRSGQGCSTALAASVATRDGTVLKTLDQSRAYILSPEDLQRRNQWQHAAQLLMAAAGIRRAQGRGRSGNEADGVGAVLGCPVANHAERAPAGEACLHAGENPPAPSVRLAPPKAARHARDRHR